VRLYTIVAALRPLPGPAKLASCGSLAADPLASFSISHVTLPQSYKPSFSKAVSTSTPALSRRFKAVQILVAAFE